MKRYMDTITGEIWTEEEIKEVFEQVRYEMEEQYDSFDEYLEGQLRNGRNHVDGLIELDEE